MRFPFSSFPFATSWLALFVATAGLSSCAPAQEQASPAQMGEGQWKTAYYKRGFVGNYKTEWADGVGATLRQRLPLSFSGSKLRITLQSARKEEVDLTKLTLAKGADDNGTIAGTPYIVTFAGKNELHLVPGDTRTVSDETAIPLTEGTWYLQSSYASPQYLYATDRDNFWSQAGDQHNTPQLAHNKGNNWVGNAFRVDVFTTDTRPLILCYGDSITQGFSSTPNTPTRYPDVLGRLLNRPTLNLGVNGDVITYSGGMPSIIQGLEGVDTVVMLIGINDIIGGQIKTPEEYAAKASNLIQSLKRNGKKVYIGTILPASGYAKFDQDPAKETLRLAINEWIKAKSGADGVIDYASALADPAHPEKMRADYQSDWLHPNDAGYQKMAETAAAVLKAG